jgi:type II secretory pathway pseudopilin PulG
MKSATRRWIIVVGLLLLFVALCVLYIPPMTMRRQLRLQLERHIRLTADIHALRAELDRYKARNGSYPATEQGLRVFAVTPKDPRGHDYVYRSPGIPHNDPYDLFSAGPDGQPNTTDDDWGD